MRPYTPQDSVSVTAYDSVWATETRPAETQDAFERTMLSEDKLYVVLGVVLLIWFGILVMLFRNERKIAQLEKDVEGLGG
ncbi:MAG: CcmD family protein [Bacteroidota bacterium]